MAVPFAPLNTVADQGTYSVQGEVKRVQQPRSFTTRNGTPSWVRNAVIHDGSDELRVVLWGENALLPLTPGDPVEIYNAPAKPGRTGDIELGRGEGQRDPGAKGSSAADHVPGNDPAGPGMHLHR